MFKLSKSLQKFHFNKFSGTRKNVGRTSSFFSNKLNYQCLALASFGVSTFTFIKFNNNGSIHPFLVCEEFVTKHNFKSEVYPLIEEIVGADNITHLEETLIEFSEENSGYAAPSKPDAVVWVANAQQVSDIVKICNKYEIPIVPYGSGTSLEGHIIPINGGIILNFSQMNKILQINDQDMDVTVQPGIEWGDLNEALSPYKLFLGADPAPGAAIGGMVGTCCSGTNAVRYGTMKNQVLNLTVVLANGEIIKTGQRARKSSAGYDLSSLFVGSEGTLGIVVEATLKLRNVGEYQAMATLPFDQIKDSTMAVQEILRKGINLAAVELFDEEMMKAVNEYNPDLNLPEKPCILFKFSGDQDHVERDVKLVKNITEKYSKYEYNFTKSIKESETVWEARKTAFWAAQALHSGKKIMATDVAVPISRMAECITETKKDLDASPLYCPIVGHVGDGNFHVAIMFDPNNPEEVKEATKLNESMVKRAIAMDGTCTGEHGVGSGKKKYLPLEFGQGAVDLMIKLKQTLDPKNILNPGKVVDLPKKTNNK